MQVYKNIQKNGLETIFINLPGSKVSSTQIWFRAGSSLEKNEDKGIAHFLEHMFFKGTKKRPGAKIAYEVESEGGEINAFTSFDYTCYYINSTNDNVIKSVDILLDMVSNPTFKKSELVPEREVVLEEYKRSQDNPGQFGFQKLQDLCFEKGYKHPILGNRKTITSFTREQLQNFRKNYYNTTNAFLVVAGDFDKNEAKISTTISKYKIPKGPKSVFNKFSLSKKPKFSIHEKDVKMAQLTIAIEAPSLTQKSSHAQEVALNIFGHGESSRLYQKLITETNFANSISSSTLHLKSGGTHFIKISFPLENKEKVCEQFINIVNQINEDGFSDRELKKIKNQYIASKIYDLETIESFSFSVGHGYAMSEELNFEEKYINAIKNVSLNAAYKEFKKLFENTIHLSVQVPIGENKPEIKNYFKSFSTKINKNVKNDKNIKLNKLQNKTISRFDSSVKILDLGNGIRILNRYNEMTPTYSCVSYIKGGLSFETQKTNGIYHLMGSLLTKGTNTHDQLEIKSIFEENSTSISSFSGRNAYGISTHGLSENIENTLGIHFDSLLNPIFPEQMFEHEKEAIERAIHSQKVDPVRLLFNKVNSTIFNGHPYSMNTLGTLENLKSFTSKQVKEIHHKNIFKNDILISTFGKIDIEYVANLIQEKINRNKKEKSLKTPITKIKPVYNSDHFIEIDREQTHIFLGIPSKPMGSKDNLIFKMLSTHLSGQSSELFVEVRDKKGLCYTVQPIHFLGLEGGYWGIYIATSNEKYKLAIESINEIITKLIKKGLNKAEFLRLKKIIKGQESLNLQTNDDHSNIYSLSALHGLKIDDYHLTLNQIESMNHSDFNESLKRILNKKFNKIVVGGKV